MIPIMFGIKDKTTGRVWSRNKWGTSFACPDLYRSRQNAQRQIDHGKISVHLKYRLGENLDPVVVAYYLTEIK